MIIRRVFEVVVGGAFVLGVNDCSFDENPDQYVDRSDTPLISSDGLYEPYPGDSLPKTEPTP